MAGFIRSRLRPDGQGTAGAQPPPGAWSSLCEPVLVLALSHLEHDDLAAAHLVSRPWRDAARLSARELRFCRQPPDTGRIKQLFPHIAELALERMELSQQALACVAGLTQLTALRLRMCQLTCGPEGGASMLALQGLRQLADLDLFEVSGPTAEALDEAIRGMTNLHRLHVESRSAACKAPSLRSLACLPRMRQLAVRQARPRQGLEGLTNLQALVELQALDLRGATVTNSIMQRLSALSALTQLRVPGAALVTDQGFEALAGLTALRELDVSCWTRQLDGPVSNRGAGHLAPLRQLTSLNLGGRSVMTAHALGYLQSFTGLQSLDLSRVRLNEGSPAFLWHLTHLTCLRIGSSQMPADQFGGLTALVRLAELDAGGTGFDDDCCCHLAHLTRLHTVSLALTQVSGRGIALLNASHPGRLRQLRLDGCRLSMGAVASTLWRQPGGVCLWDAHLRGHLPRWVNVANTLLMTGGVDGTRRLRLLYAPEPSWLRQAGMAVAVAGLMSAYVLLLLATMAVLLALPALGFAVAAALLLMYATGKRVVRQPVLRVAARAELLLSAVLVGVLSIDVPPPPANLQHWHF